MYPYFLIQQMDHRIFPVRLIVHCLNIDPKHMKLEKGEQINK